MSDNATAGAGDASAAASASAVEAKAAPGDVVVTLSGPAFAVAQRIADLRKTSVAQAMADALALQETVATEQSTGARLLIERHGDVEELAG